ncbi:MAG: CDP-diacylglycerol--glycerol-3-phosphate 3-phosphatidyltransferase [Oscillospiraceae bacterium]|jgi:CDP-diacylglycerol--glycerol-3-phosphate 3-phosphatidyltransferase|nr:CDP-diacylglycerol--glycerol-3-phosphate 3-phosphatidyltransferase [Oscillospiraceae bacterium]
MNTPNKLTIIRMIITPIFLVVFLATGIPHNFLLGLIIFAIGAITDFADGKLARKYNQVTVFGKLTDPIADKMLTTAALLAFMQFGLCNIWIVMIVLTREFAITSVRMVASAQGVVIPANIWGKLKTASQMVFTILIMLLGELKNTGVLGAGFDLPLLSNVLLWIMAVLTVLSGAVYLHQSKGMIDFSK